MSIDINLLSHPGSGSSIIVYSVGKDSISHGSRGGGNHYEPMVDLRTEYIGFKIDEAPVKAELDELYAEINALREAKEMFAGKWRDSAREAQLKVYLAKVEAAFSKLRVAVIAHAATKLSGDHLESIMCEFAYVRARGIDDGRKEVQGELRDLLGIDGG